MIKNRKYSFTLLWVILTMILFNGNSVSIQIKNNKFEVRVKQVINYDFPYLSSEECQKALNEAKEILRNKLGIDVEFLITKNVDSTTFFSKIGEDEIKDCCRYIELSSNPKKFSEYIKKDIKNKLDLQLISREEIMTYFPSKKFKNINEMGEEITKNYFKTIRKLENEKIINRNKMYYHFSGCFCRVITKNNDCDIIITNMPVIPSISQADDPNILSGQVIMGTFCRGISTFPIHYFEKLDREKVYKTVGYQISHLLAKMICILPVVHNKRYINCVLHSGGMTESYYKRYLNVINTPACKFERTASKIGEGFYKIKDMIISKKFQEVKVELNKTEKLLKRSSSLPIIKSYIDIYTSNLLFLKIWIGIKEGKRKDVKDIIKKLVTHSPYIDSIIWFYFADDMKKDLTFEEIKFIEKNFKYYGENTIQR